MLSHSIEMKQKVSPQWYGDMDGDIDRFHYFPSNIWIRQLWEQLTFKVVAGSPENTSPDLLKARFITGKTTRMHRKISSSVTCCCNSADCLDELQQSYTCKSSVQTTTRRETKIHIIHSVKAQGNISLWIWISGIHYWLMINKSISCPYILS